jgi:hypothetical protein
MKKSQLKEVVQNIIRQKLTENASTYGYVISGAETGDPVVQLRGFGNMKLSQWKRKTQEELEEVAAWAKEGNYKNVAHVLKAGGLLLNQVNMINEIEPKDIEEALDTDSAAAANPVMKPSVSPSQKDQQALADYQKKLDDLTDEVKSIDAQISKLNEPVQKRIAQLNIQKAQKQKQQGPLVDKIGQLQKKISDETAAGAQTTTQS